MDLIKTVYLGSVLRPALAASGNDRAGISTSTEGNSLTVQVNLAGEGIQESSGIAVSVGLLQSGHSWADKYSPACDWVMKSAQTQQPYHITASGLAAAIPEATDWTGSVIRGERSGILASVAPLIQPGEIPDSKSDVCMVTDWDLSGVTTDMIPGESIAVEHQYLYAPAVTASGGYFRTHVLTGGTITAKRPHPTVTGAFVYDLVMDGDNQSDVETADWYEYDVGDFVLVMMTDKYGLTYDLVPQQVADGSPYLIVPWEPR